MRKVTLAPGVRHGARRWGRRVALLLALLVGLALLTLALPVRDWRSGEPEPARPLPGAAPLAPVAAERLWIDSDAACGSGPRVDPDDCLAIVMLAARGAPPLEGLSSVFGNAPLATTDATLRALAAQLPSAPPVARGADAPGRSSAAAQALGAALDRGPLVIVALGPLTNLARALAARPARAQAIRRLFVVMGQRREHLFHPVEGGTARSWFGHGPVFRDLNYAKDPAAADAVLAQVPAVVALPYEAARQTSLGGEDLDRLARTGAAGAWVAARAQDWLAYWQRDIGRPGFMPFDVLAAAALRAPSSFTCAPARLRGEEAPWLLRQAGVARRLVVEADARATARYCFAAQPGVLTGLLAAS